MAESLLRLMNDDRINLFGEFTLDLARGCVTRSGEPVHLRPQTYEVLKYLAENHGRLISKDKLIEEVWRGRAVTDGSLGKCIEEVREALGPEARQYVRNVRGRGYILDIEEDRNGGPHAVRTEQLDLVSVLIEDEEETSSTLTVPANLAANIKSIAPEHSQAQSRRDRINRYTVLALLLLFAVIAAGIFGYFKFFGAGPLPITSVAVLPFTNATGDPDMEYLSDGLGESIINNLSQLPGLRVMSRNSSYGYKGRDFDARRIGNELNVQALLTGSIHRRGDVLSITVELINPLDNSHIWGEQYNRKMPELPLLQTDIARDVSHNLRSRLSSTDERKVAKNYTANREAYELYLKGRYYHHKLSLPEIRKGIDFYQQAINVDPTYALAYAGLASAYRSLAIAGMGVPSKEAYPQAKAAARRALEIDPDLGEAHVALGWVEFSFDWDWSAAEGEFKKAIALGPDDPGAHLGYAHLFSILGRGEEAIAEGKRARQLDPLWLIANGLEGQFLFYAGHHDEAIARFQKTLEIDPSFWIAHNGLARVYILQGLYDEAIASLRKAIEASGGSNEPTTQLGYVLAKSGRRQEARAVLRQLESPPAQSYVPAYSFAMIHNGLGEREEALKYLEKSLQEREVQLTFLKIDSRWDDLRTDPRFQEIVRSVGLPS